MALAGLPLYSVLIDSDFAAELDARNVAQPHLGAVLVDAQQDLLELLDRLQPRGADHGRIELVASNRRQAADLAGRDLHVLAADRVVHVDRRERVAVEPGGIEPDAHGELRTEHLVIADTRRAAQWILHVGDEEIADGAAIHAAVG